MFRFHHPVDGKLCCLYENLFKRLVLYYMAIKALLMYTNLSKYIYLFIITLGSHFGYHLWILVEGQLRVWSRHECVGKDMAINGTWFEMGDTILVDTILSLMRVKVLMLMFSASIFNFYVMYFNLIRSKKAIHYAGDKNWPGRIVGCLRFC